jgi:hypothetical protein
MDRTSIRRPRGYNNFREAFPQRRTGPIGNRRAEKICYKQLVLTLKPGNRVEA